VEKERLKSKKRICSEVSVNSTGDLCPEEEIEGYDGKDWQKRKVLSLK